MYKLKISVMVVFLFNFNSLIFFKFGLNNPVLFICLFKLNNSFSFFAISFNYKSYLPLYSSFLVNSSLISLMIYSKFRYSLYSDNDDDNLVKFK